MRSRLFTCERTVCSEMKRRLAISSVPRCSSRRSRTSTSRAESVAAIASGTPEPRPLPWRTCRAGGGRPAGECGLAVHDAVEERGNPLGRLGLQQIAGRTRADRREEVLLGARGGEDDDLDSGAASRSRGSAAGRRGRASRDRAGRDPDGACSASTIASSPSEAQPKTSNPCALEQRGEGLAGQRMVVDDEDPGGHCCLLSAANLLPTRGK